ncbi:MAG: hypothetical protein SFV17_11450, partial [Candidatus Obscuribacter sp.]|nr:hypothetical protein [Candidatus Obscuribacter sp.]
MIDNFHEPYSKPAHLSSSLSEQKQPDPQALLRNFTPLLLSMESPGVTNLKRKLIFDLVLENLRQARCFGIETKSHSRKNTSKTMTAFLTSALLTALCLIFLAAGKITAK